MVADFVFKFGMKKRGVERQRILLPVHAQLGVDALFRLEIVVADTNLRIGISAVDAGKAGVVLA
jgi:hypothetical protein